MKNDSIVVGLGSAGLMVDYYKNKIIKSHAKAYNLHPNFNLTCSVDKKKSARELFKKKYNKPSYPNFNFKLKNSSFVASICCPTKFHKKCINQLLIKFKPKVILCEKPIAQTLNDAKLILDICKKKKIKIFVNYTRVAEPIFKKIKLKIKNSKNFTGKVIYNNGFLNNGSHYFNLMTFLFGRFTKYQNLKIISKFNNDVNLNVNLIFERASIDFNYKKGSISNDITLKNKNFYIKNYKKKFLLFNKKKISRVLNYYQYNILNELNNYIRNKKSNSLCTGVQAFKELKILNNIIKKK